MPSFDEFSIRAPRSTGDIILISSSKIFNLVYTISKSLNEPEGARRREKVLRNGNNPTVIDQRNATRLRVLEQIRTSGQISRIDIAASLQTSPATVTSATADLMAAGLIHETAGEASPDAAKRGRPRVLLELNANSNIIAGVKVARDVIMVMLVDFQGNELAQTQFRLTEPRMSAETLVVTIGRAVNEACETLGKTIADVSGIAIGLAGQVVAEQNFIYWSSSITENNVDLDPILSQQLPCPAFVENDANLVAKGEQLFGLGQGLQNFLVITIEHGVGLGIVLGGALYRGERGCGAEFGHTKVQLDGALCQCGQRGCLEAYVSDYALMREAVIAMQDDKPSSVADIRKSAEDGNPSAIAVLERASRMFGMGVSNLVNLFDPERIILSGRTSSIEHLCSEQVKEHIRNNVVQVDAPTPEILAHDWGGLMWAKGAAAYGIEQVSVLQVLEMNAHGA